MTRLRPQARLLPVALAALLLAPGGVALAQDATPLATPPPTTRLFELPGEAIFPEGVVVDPETGTFYVSSTTNGTIFRGDVESGGAEIFIPGAEGRSFAGLELDGAGRLYAAGANTGQVFVFDAATGAPIAIYTNGLSPNTFLNDIAITPNGDVFVTDSFNAVLYRLPAGQPAAAATPVGVPSTPIPLVSFVNLAASGFQLGEGFNANGIVTSDDGTTLLLVQANTGLLYRIDVASGTVQQVDLGDEALTGGDGMILDGRTLYVVREGQITAVELGEDLTTGQVIDSFSDPTLSSPTTIAPYDGCLLVVNSQFANRGGGGQPVLPFTLSGIPIPPSVLEAAGEPASTGASC